jgi:FkbH-like protein
MELAEVQTVFPGIECLLFPTHDDQAIHHLLIDLRDKFGKATLSKEDSIRLESLRNAQEIRIDYAQAGTASIDTFLREAKSEIRFSFEKTPVDSRAFELINKTNQFNLNGRRFGEGEWLAGLREDRTFLLRISYEDKFGPLGTIAVLFGRIEGSSLTIDVWVMSCRAFSRRIEHQCLSLLFDHFGVNEITLDFKETPNNKPLQEFLATFGPPANLRRISLDSLTRQGLALYHTLKGWTDE